MASWWRRVSLATKLPLALSAVLLLILGGMTLSSYAVVRRGALDLVTARLDGATRQVTSSLEASLRRPSAAQQMADFPATRELLRRGAGRERVLDTMRAVLKRATKGADPTIELWSAGGDRVLSVGSGAVAMPLADVRKLTDALSPTQRIVIGPFRRDSTGVLTQAGAAVVDGGKVIGWVVDNRRVVGNPQTSQLLTGLIGSEARLLLGNIRGDVFTDFAGAATGPPAPVDWTKGVTRYIPVGRPEVLARGVPLAGTPWVVVVEFPRGVVMSAPNRFLLVASLVSVLLIAVGAALGQAVSRPVTTPLLELTEAAEKIAAGEPTPGIETDREDEVGRLAASFTTMARRVEASRTELERTVDRYRLLFDENPLPMWVYDRETRTFVDVNEMAMRRYGFSREEFLAMMSDPKRENGGMPSWPFDASVPPGQHNGRRAHRHRLKDGAHIDVELTGQDVELDGRPVTLIAANDVTSRLAAELALREREEELQRFNADLEKRVAERTVELEQANKELEAFSYSVSHDLRAPLRAIAGFSRMLLDDQKDKLTPDVREPIEVVERNAKQMGQLLDDLLAFSRFSRKPLSMAKVDMTALAKAAADEARRGEPAGREIDVCIRSLPAAKGEPTMLRQVLVNLLSNAMKFTRKRTPAKIEVGCEDRLEGRAYFVRDNGVGFDMRYAGKLFGVFERLHRQDEYEGTGVGLAIVDRIVRRHGGQTWADAAVDRGTTISFTLGTTRQDAS